ncbi:MAG: hypothetical protein P9X24_00840 [Candidatus Hatepunaea meridiana]|nr:hypothetical protein [Candidatus Hatepunaea meridiana]
MISEYAESNCNNGVTMRRRVLLLGLVVLMGVGGWNGVFGREWSDEVRMTDSESNYLSSSNLTVKVDGRDNIHAVYDYMRYQDERIHNFQAVYQKFNRFGEALSDPLVIGYFADWSDSAMWCFDLFVDNNDNVYILWGNRDSKHYTKLDRDGEVSVENVQLGGLGGDLNYNNAKPQMVVDSEGNIILLVCFSIPIGAPREELEPSIIYARYTPEGRMIGSLHQLWTIGYYGANFRDLGFEIDNGDTLHIGWEFQCHESGFTVHYSMVAPDDEIIVDDFRLPQINEHQRITYEAFAIDSMNRPLFLMTSNDEYNLLRLTSNLECDFSTYIGRHYRISSSHSEEILISENENIHLISTIHDDNLNRGIEFIGYTELNNDGEIIDSLQVIHDHLIREGGNRPAYWNGIQIFSCSDETIGVIWGDDRHSDYQAGVSHELYMRFSIQENSVSLNNPALPNFCTPMLSNFPNPFNESTLLSFWIRKPGFYNLKISDMNGRFVFYRDHIDFKTGIHYMEWESRDMLGNPSPSGSYIFTLSNDIMDQSRIITLTR